MERTGEKPHSKFPHVHAIVRIDSRVTLENQVSIVQVLASREQAEHEAARLREVNDGKDCAYIQTTRFMGLPLAS
jgi:hypothetical protein